MLKTLSKITLFWWGIAVLLYAAMVFYVLPRNYSQFPDGVMMYAGVKLAYQHFFSQDIKLMVRPGYLLNLPLMWLGFSHYGMKVFCLLLKAGAFTLFALSFDKSVGRKALLPIGLIVMLGCYAQQSQAILDYYSAVLLFCLLGFAAYFHSFKKKPWLWSSLAGLCFALAIMSNFGIFPAIVFGVLALAVFNHRRSDIALILVFVLVFAALFGSYLTAGHVWSTYVSAFDHGHSFKYVKTAFALSVLLFFVMVILVMAPVLTFQSCNKRVREGGELLYLIFIYGYLCTFIWHLQMLFTSYLMCGLVAAMAVSFLILLYRMTHASLDKPYKRRCLMVGVFFIVLLLNNRVISEGYLITFVYYPIVFFVAICAIEKAWPNGLVMWVQSILLLMFLLIPASQILTFKFQFPIWHNQYPSHMGVKVDRYTANMEHNLLSAYQQNNCANKAYLSYYGLVESYLITNRQPPFRLFWLPVNKFQMLSKKDNAVYIKSWLARKQHWCVVYGQFTFKFKKPFRLRSVTAYLLKESNKIIKLGYIPYRQRVVWMFVK